VRSSAIEQLNLLLSNPFLFLVADRHHLGTELSTNNSFNTPALPSELARRHVRALLADRQGVVWVSLASAGLFRWNGQSLEIESSFARIQTIAPYRLAMERTSGSAHASEA